MKAKYLPVFFMLSCFMLNGYSQSRQVIPDNLRNVGVELKYQKPSRDNLYGTSPAIPLPTAKGESFSEHTLGTTEYDSQTNKSLINRIHLFPDKTIGAIWTYGTGNFADRGTGYNYFNGTAWGEEPQQRIEGDTRTGWGSYAPYKNGEIVVAHDGVSNLIMSTTEVKGSNEWTKSTIIAPEGAELTWPRVITVGDTIHVLSVSFVDYQEIENPIIYSRSVDNGATWTHQILPGMDFASGQLAYSADVYAWATPQNGKLAFVVGSSWSDMFIMKSLDGGNTWQKNVIFQHPNPFCFQNVVPLDSTYAPDGAMDIEFDKNGKLQVVFGVTRVLVTDPAAETYTWFPFVSYLGYWNEDMGLITNMDIQEMIMSGKAIAWLQDLDEDGTLFADLTDVTTQIKSYGGHGLVSMPQIAIDDDNAMYVTFSHMNENLNNGAPNYAYYRHIWATKSTDGGLTWSEFSEITGGIINEFSECIFGSLSETSDDYIHLAYQMDEIPGLGTGTNADHQQNTNSIIYIKVLKTDIGETSANISDYNTINTVSVFPNPTVDEVYISVVSPIITDAKISIKNILGQTVLTTDKLIKAGNNSFPIKLGSNPAGMYFVTVEAKNYTSTHKVLLQK